jgi:transposase
LHLHHGRQLLVRQRVALNNHMRGILLEYGISLPVGARVVSQQPPALLEDAEKALPPLTRHLLAELKAEHDQLVGRIKDLETQLKHWHQHSPVGQQLASIPGIGLLTATALAATAGEANNFKNGRQLAAYLGLVPRQASSGGKERLLGISKRGDRYVRTLLIHGARAVILHLRRRLKAGRPGGHPWLEQVLQRCHVNEAAGALQIAQVRHMTKQVEPRRVKPGEPLEVITSLIR